MGFSLVTLIDGDEGCIDASHMGYYGLIVWLLLVLYMFIGLYILCEHYFVPILLHISKRLNMSEDVTGATLMAAGSSSPELFTALIGIILYPDENPGPSTNCASAAFNMCIIIGSSIWFSGYSTLPLRGYPFTRDCVFYATSILELYLFYEVISPGIISFVEASSLVLTWIVYVLILVYNNTVIKVLMRVFMLCGINISDEKAMRMLSYSQWQLKAQRSSVSPADANRNPVIDKKRSLPLEIAIAMMSGSNNVSANVNEHIGFMDADTHSNNHNTPYASDTCSKQTTYLLLSEELRGQKQSNTHPNPSAGSSSKNMMEKTKTKIEIFMAASAEKQSVHKAPSTIAMSVIHSTINNSDDTDAPPKNNSQQHDDDDDNDKDKDSHGLTTTTPRAADTLSARVWRMACLPFRFVFAQTILHTRVDSHLCRLVSAFVLCLVWLGGLTFLCVDATEKIGNCFALTPDVMGLTLLAVGSSLPDCFSSILAAKQGKGGMAVSNALGSNVFDICICVGFSFMVKSMMNAFRFIKVDSAVGFELFIMALFLLLALFMVMMYSCGLVLTRRQGVVLFMAYFAFLGSFCYILEFDD